MVLGVVEASLRPIFNIGPTVEFPVTFKLEEESVAHVTSVEDVKVSCFVEFEFAIFVSILTPAIFKSEHVKFAHVKFAHVKSIKKFI